MWEGPVMVDVRFVGARANADIDNLLKSVLDAIQGVIIVDDKQVVEIKGVKRAYKGKQTQIFVSQCRDGGE